MNDTITQFNALLEKYKLIEPVSPEQQEFIIKQRKAELKKLLKKTGQYGIVIWLSILIFERLRDWGISLTLVQGKIILGLTVAAIASGTSIGGYMAAKYVIKAVLEPERKIEERTEEKTEEIKPGHILDEDKPPQTGPAENIKMKEKTAPIKKVEEDSQKNETQTDIKKIMEKSDPAVKKKQKKDFEAEPVSDVPSL